MYIIHMYIKIFYIVINIEAYYNTACKLSMQACFIFLFTCVRIFSPIDKIYNTQSQYIYIYNFLVTSILSYYYHMSLGLPTMSF